MPEPLAKALGQRVVVDNKPGACGTIGGAEAVRSAPDVHTLMLSNSTPLSICTWTVPKQPDDPIKQFTDVAMLGMAPVAILANPKTGPASLGSGGPGSIGHTVGEMAKDAMRFNMTHVPDRGGALMTTDLIAGHQGGRSEGGGQRRPGACRRRQPITSGHWVWNHWPAGRSVRS